MGGGEGTSRFGALVALPGVSGPSRARCAGVPRGPHRGLTGARRSAAAPHPPTAPHPTPPTHALTPAPCAVQLPTTPPACRALRAPCPRARHADACAPLPRRELAKRLHPQASGFKLSDIYAALGLTGLVPACMRALDCDQSHDAPPGPGAAPGGGRGDGGGLAGGRACGARRAGAACRGWSRLRAGGHPPECAWCV